MERKFYDRQKELNILKKKFDNLNDDLTNIWENETKNMTNPQESLTNYFQ